MKLALLSVVSHENQMKKFVQTMCPPLGLYYIESYLKKHMPSVKVFISTDPEMLLYWKPDIIGIASVTENFRLALDSIKKIRNYTKVPIIMGGVHITFLPEQLPYECALGVLGEGEVTLLEVLQIYEKDGKFTENNLKDIPGIVYRNNKNEIIITPARPVISSLDEVPFPVRDRIDPLGITHVISSRGCPYKCIFCSTSKFWNSFRAHSAEYVAMELKDIMERIKPPHIKFFDDLFIANKKRMEELADIVEKEGLRPPYGFSCFARAELLDRDMAEILKKMGFSGIAIGIESGSPDVLKRLKGHSTLEINQNALDICKEYGFHTTCSFVLGTPGEKGKDLQMTYNYILKNEDKITEIEICPIVPFPGTPLWDYALERGLVSYSMDWGLLEDYSIFTNFNIDRYIYLNENMSLRVFKNYCIRFMEMYRYFTDRCQKIYGDFMQPKGSEIR